MSYQAFISYSHAADGKLAPALQSGLQKIAKPFYRLRSMRVFRGETSLRLTPKLWPTIQKAIDESENFVLMASPDSAASEWVQKEVEAWLRKDSDLNNFSIVLTEGDIFWDKQANDFDLEKTTALPDILRGKFESEPLYLDFRWARESEQLSLRNPQFLNSVGKLAAAIRGEELDIIIGEDVQQHRLFKRVAGAVIVLLLFLLAATSYAAVIATRQTRTAREQQTIAEAATQEAEVQRDNALKAQKEAKDALNRETEAKNQSEEKTERSRRSNKKRKYSQKSC